MSGIFRGPLIVGLLVGWALGSAEPVHAGALEKVRVLIIDGQNNHNWRAMTPPMKAELERSGRFTVDVVTTPGPKASDDLWKTFRPEFSKYDVVLSNYNGEMWPEEVRKSLEEYVSSGGGLAIIHAANNAFEEWPAFNRMIGLGWRRRSLRRSFDSRRCGQSCSYGEGRRTRIPVTVRRTNSRLLSGIRTTRLRGECRRSGCTPRTSFITASAGRPRTWRSWPRLIPRRRKGAPARMSR